MPANLDISQNIIAAFNQGRQLKLQREEQARVATQQQFQNEQEKQAADLRQKQYDEGIRQYNESQKAEKDFRDKGYNLTKAIHDAQMFKEAADRQQELQDRFLAGKGTPTGYQETNPGVFSPPPGADPTQFPEFTTGGETPQSQAQKIAGIQETIQGPANAAKLALEEVQRNAAYKQAMDVAKEATRRALEVEALRQQGDKTSTKANSLERLLNPAELEAFGGLPLGTRVKDALGIIPGVKQTPQQIDYTSALKRGQAMLQTIKDDFNPEKGGLKYSDYFQSGKGLFGAVTSLGTELQAKAGLHTTEKAAKARRDLANMQLIAKEIEQLGSALSGIEKPMLSSSITGPEQNQDPKTAKAGIEGYDTGLSSYITNYEKSIKARTIPSGGNKPSLLELYNATK